MIFDPGSGNHVVIDGHVVERDVYNIAQKLKDYDENLTIICLDPDMPDVSVNDAPFIICEEKPDGRLIRIFECWKLDDTIMERIFQADQQRFDLLDRTVTMEQMLKKQREDRYKDRQAEVIDMLAHVLASDKQKYSFKDNEGQHATIDEFGTVEKNHGRMIPHAGQ